MLLAVVLLIPALAGIQSRSADAGSSGGGTTGPADTVTTSNQIATQGCRMEAAAAAVVNEQRLYDTHPAWQATAPSVAAPIAEHDAYAALLADEDAKWTEIMRRVYVSCEGPEDWWLAALEHPNLAGVTHRDAVDSNMLELWCAKSPESRACIGLDIWWAEHPDRRLS